LALTSVFLLLAALGVFLNIPGASGWVFWKYNTGDMVSSVAVSLGSNYTVAGTENGDLFLLDKQGTLVWSKFLGNEVEGLSISGDGNRILVGVAEYSTGEPDVFLFNNEGNTIWEKDLITDYNRPCDVSISQDGNYIATGDTGHKVRFFNSSGYRLWEKELGDWATCVSVSSTGDYIASGSWDDNVYLFNQSGDQLWSYDTEYGVYGVSISPEGGYVASVGNKIFFFDSGGHQLWNITSYYGDGISVSANGNYIAAGEKYDEEITLLNRTGGEIWNWSVGSKVNSVAVTSDGKFVVAGADDGFVYFIENLQPTSMTCMVFEPKISLGEEVNVSGSIDPPIEGVEVTFAFVRPNNTTVTVDATTTTGGVYNQTYAPDTIGFWTVQASWNGDAIYMGAESPIIPFSVGESTITCEVSNWQIYMRENIVVSGSIDPPHIGVEVTLTYTDPADVVFNRTVTTTGDGNYSDTLTPNFDGMWRVLASWPGDIDTMSAVSSEVRFLVSTVTEVSVKIGQNQTFHSVFQPPTDYHYSPMFEDIVWDENITSPSGVNFTTIEGVFTYHETIPGLGGTITSYNVTYNIGVLEETAEGIYNVTAYYDISSQSGFWPYTITFLFRYELRCRVNAVVKYETSIALVVPPQVKLGEAAAVSGTIVPTGGPPVEGVNVTLSYTKPDSSIVNRTVTTETDGSFQDAYIPDMSGAWSLKASWTGDEDHNGAESLQVEFDVLTDLMHEVTWDMGVYFIRTLSNSTVSAFLFNGTALQIGFNVSGLLGTEGFCNVTIPKSLLQGDPWTITIDDTPITDSLQNENDTHSFLYFTYMHPSTLQVIIQGTWIIPEFPLFIVLPLFMIATLIAATIFRRRTS
jgi:hypothetical protein